MRGTILWRCDQREPGSNSLQRSQHHPYTEQGFYKIEVELE